MYAVLSAIVMGIAMVSIDQTVLPVALPMIQQNFLASAAQTHWTIDGYFLSIAVFMLAGGKLSDLFGQRLLFILGIILFGVASLVCGISPNIHWLIISRFLQGIGGALLLPPCIPILLSVFPDNKKGFAVGLQSAFSSFFLIIGPFLGGFLTQYFSWRSIFFINIPLSILALFLTFKFVPKSLKTKKHFDLLGFGSYSLGIVFLTIAIMQAQTWGWIAFSTVIFFVLGISFLAFLYRTDKRTKDPFVNFSLFRHRTFKEAGLSIFTSAFQLMIVIFLPIFLQQSMQFSPTQAGFYMTITSIPIAIASPLAGKLLDRYGFKMPIVLGQSLTIFAFLWMVAVLPFHQFSWIVPALLMMSLGFTSIMTPSFSAGVSCIEQENRGIASGMLGTIRSLGANFGVAITGTLIADTQSRVLFQKIASDEQTASLSTSFLTGLIHSMQPAIDTLHHLPDTLQNVVTTYFNQSYQYAFGIANAVDAALGLIGLFGVFVWFKRSFVGNRVNLKP